MTQSSGANLPGGHVAALYQGEIYELQAGRAGVALLQRFGVHLGHQRVVVYVEPKSDGSAAITSNTARTHLLMDSEPLPWSDWAEAFREALPAEIRSLIESIGADREARDYEKSIRERLREIEDILRVQKYRASAAGSLRVSDATELGDLDARGDGTTAARSSTGRSGSTPRKPRDIYTFFLVEEGGQPGEKVRDRLDVKVEWVREGDMPQPDRAAHYIPETRLLQISQDFRVFTGFIDRWEKRYRQLPGAKAIVTDIVHEWFHQTLLEVIYSVDFLRGSREWTDDEVARAYSDEALTAAVLPRYHTEMAVRRALGSRLGALTKDKSA